MSSQQTELDSGKKSVVLVDDHPVVALGLRLAFQDHGGYALVGAAQEPEAAVGLIAAHKPDAIVVDLVFSGTVALSIVSACRTAAPHSPIVVFSSLPARHYEQQALDAGADAYVTKEDDLPGLVARLGEILAAANAGARERGGLAETMDGSSVRLALGDVHLTPREIEIGRMLSRGLSVARIAEEIGISANTVAAHRDNIRKKLGCRDMVELIALLARIHEVPRRA